MILGPARALVMAATWPSWRRFQRALADPEGAQDAVLARLVAGMSATRYGAHFGLRPTDAYEAFAQKLPIVDYDALAPWIDEQKAREERILCPTRVLFYEKTSGSSGPAKWIPYTSALYRSFGRAFALWLRDLLTDGPELATGRTWLSVSPFPSRNERTERGVRVGLESDADYASGWLGRLLLPFWTLPPSVRGLTDPLAFRDAVALHLLEDSRLEAISLWNPSMLTSVLEHVVARREALLPGLSPARARTLAPLLDAPDAEGVDWLSVWPRLKLLSCWDQALAGPAAATAARLLPGVFVQGKGHLATEAPVTIPLVAAKACAPLVDETFLEFEESPGAVRRLHELEPGGEYQLLISQQGGLCRYRLGDRVRAGKRVKATPTLALIGRADPVCDLVGEKLHEAFVAGALADSAPDSRFKLLIPVPARPGRAASYLLVADRAAAGADALARRVDEKLGRNPHFRSARDLGQLAPTRAVVRPDAREAVESYFVSRGRVWGALKPSPLLRDPADGARLEEALR